MTRIGIVGIGFMGHIHYQAAKRLQSAAGTGAPVPPVVAAVCTRNPKKLAGDWTSIRGNFGPPGGHEDLSRVKKYNKLDDLLADPEIDLVDVCLPTDQHPDAAIRALRAGKHVLVEKSIALSVEDADAMLRAAEQAGRLLMVAHVLPFFPDFAFARDAIASGRYGKLLAAHFKRVISPPDWSADIASLEKTGGPGIDLHIHDTHFIALACGKPKAVYSRGILEGPYARFLTTQYLFDGNGPAVSCTSGDLSKPGCEFTHAFEIYLEHATLLYEFATLDRQPVLAIPLSVLTADGKVERPQLGSGDPIDSFAAELAAAVEGVRTGNEPELLSGKLARDALNLCHREAESVRLGRPVAV